jgi:hypothetical protein
MLLWQFSFAFALLQPFIHILRKLYSCEALYEHKCRDVLPDGGSTSPKVKGELEVTITHVYSHEIAHSIRTMPIIQNNPILSYRLQG